jgi:hypothetical protein
MHGFPAALASFIGRARALREVAGLLGECRLVTVTGPGGVGKTRLAGEVAGQVAGRFADGAWLAELAAVRDPAQVAAVVAAALGIREQPGVPAAGALARVLARRQLLLVLDNCEHVIGAAAAAPGCWLLVMMCGCWRPAGSRWPWPGRRGTGWARCPYPPPVTRRVRAARRRWRCSPTAPARPMRISS